MVKLAAVSCASDPRNKQANLDKMVEWCTKAAEQGVNMIVFPEDHLTGLGVGELGMTAYNAEDKMYWAHNAELVPEGPSTQKMIEVAKQFDMYICWGMSERDPNRASILHNCSVLVGPEGFVGKYRKVHLPLCERLWVTPGTDFPVFDTKWGKVGLMTCFDKMYPEAARCLAVKGAEIILCGTGWPNLTQSEDDPDHKAYLTFTPARALENQIVWVEATTGDAADAPVKMFEGHSMIWGPNAQQLLAMTGFGEDMAVAEIDLQEEIFHARFVDLQGSTLLEDRVPSAYWPLTAYDEYSRYAQGLKEYDEWEL